MSTTLTSGFVSLQNYLTIQRDWCEAYIGNVQADIVVPGLNGAIRLHYVKCDENGYPMFQQLAKCLSQHIVGYCLSARRRGSAVRPHEHAALWQRARDLFTMRATSGEVGELLLYFLIEAILSAPQVVAKMELKTSSAMEVHGSDGIHMRWDTRDGTLNIYFGESKLIASVSKALRESFESLQQLEDPAIQEHEFGLVTSHFKWVDGPIVEAINDLTKHKPLATTCVINHVCLIGYNWKVYRRLMNKGFAATVDVIKEKYLAHANRLISMFARHFNKYAHKRYRFEVFVLPFDDVQKFRDEFVRAL